MNKRGTTLLVDVFGLTNGVLQEAKDEFLAQGYDLRFYDNLQAFSTPPSKPNICIVDVSKINQCHPYLTSVAHPYLVSGVNFLKDLSLSKEVLSQSVGCINGKLSTSEICIHIQLGMLWHQEREHTSRRVQDIDEKIKNNRITGVAIGMLMQKTELSEQDILDCLKSESRNKQRRMVDASLEVIVNLQESKDSSFDSLDALKSWLKLAIPKRP